MQVSVEKLSNIERRLTITVPSDQVDAAYNKQLQAYVKKANIKGFRPGKVPVSVIQQRFGAEARQEALNEVIQTSLFKAINDEKLQPISTPKVEPKSIVANQPLEFTVSFEVLPELATVVCKINTLETLAVDITEADVDRVLEQLAKQYTKWDVASRGAEKTDRVVIDYFAIFEGKEEKEQAVTNYPVEIGGQMMIPGFEEDLLGKKAGDTCRLNLSFPEDYNLAERAGKPVEFAVTIKQVYAAVRPALNDDFAKTLGIKSGKVEELRTQIKESLELERDRLVKDKLKEQIFNQLIEQNKMDVPQSLVSRETQRIHDEIYPQHQGHEHDHSEDEMAQFKEIAEKRVALGLLVAEYAKQNNIKADPERVTKRIQEIASAYEKPEQVIEYLSKNKQKADIESQVIEDQIIEKLQEGVSLQEKKITYADLKGIRI